MSQHDRFAHMKPGNVNSFGMNGHDTRSVHGSADTLGPQPSSLDFTHNMSPMLSRQDFANDLLGPEVSATPGSKAHDGSLARLKSWYMHESPWVPKSIVPGAEERYGNDPVVLSPDFSRPSFSHYRAGIALSDHDGLGTATHMSDSGYASAPPHYKHQDDDHTTMYEDDSQSLVQGLSDLTVPGASVDGFHAHESVSQHHGWDQPQPSVQAVSANVNPVAVSLGNYPCQVTGCGKSFRTKAEYNKHHLHHTKPHHCAVEGCPRKEGFTTQNDLIRHLMSKHPEHAPESVTFYHCPHSPCDKKKPKQWPRADNFRNHLKNVHKIMLKPDAGLAEYEIRPIQSTPADFAGLGSAAAVDNFSDVNIAQADMDAPAAPNLDDITGGIDRDLSISPNSSPVPGNRGRGAAIGAGSTTQPHVEAHYHTLETPCTAQQHASDLAAVAPASLAKSLPQNVGQQGRVVPQQPQHVVAHSRTGSFRSTAALESSVSGGARICQVAAGHQLGANATPNCDAELLDGPLPEGVADGVQENVTPLVGQRFTEPTESSAEQDVAGSSASDTGSNSVKSQSSGASHCGGSAHSDLTDLLPAATTGRPGHEAEEESEDVKDLVHKLQLLQSGKQMDILKKLLDGNPELRQALATLGDTASSSTSTSASSGKEQKKFRCTKCEKLFSRQCELRKHMKRHAKPFHCTSDGCRKSFGSKNDWKRHENSQHFQLEVWRCDQRSKTAGSMLCSKVCHRRESFRTHLRDHGITDGAVIDDKLDKCRVGRSCEQRFWCGFCKKVIDIREKGLGAWTTRFDHICNHFNQGCIKEDWQPFDERYDARQASAVDDRASASSPSTTSLSSLFAPSSPEPASPMSLDTNRKRTRSPSADEDTEALQPSKKLRTKKTEYRVTCCLCSHEFNQKTTPACVNDEHVFCNSCVLSRVEIEDDELPN